MSSKAVLTGFFTCEEEHGGSWKDLGNYSLNQYLLSAYYVSNTVLSLRDRAEDKRRSLSSRREADNKYS